MSSGLFHFDLPGRPLPAAGVLVLATVTDTAPLTVEVDGVARKVIASRTAADAIAGGTLNAGDRVAALPIAGNAEQLVVLDVLT